MVAILMSLTNNANKTSRWHRSDGCDQAWSVVIGWYMDRNVLELHLALGLCLAHLLKDLEFWLAIVVISE
jgi:hypothetical protein